MPDPTLDPNVASASAVKQNAPLAAADTAPALSPQALTLPPESKYEWLAGLREITTTIIAIVILAVTIRMLWLTFVAAGTDFDKMKDVMLYALTILGTVMGFYFGRVPAERRAEVSEKTAGEAQNTAQAATTHSIQTQQQTDQKLKQVKIGVERAKAKLEAAGGASQHPGTLSGLGSSPVPGAPATSSAYDELDAISKIL